MNIAEILKYCPEGTKLYSTIYGEVVLRNVYIDKKYPIEVVTCNSTIVAFTKEGHYIKSCPNTECILFPSKDQKDWNKFRLPVKRGDIMMETNGKYPFIATGELCGNISPKYICGIGLLDKFQLGSIGMGWGWTSNFYIPASEEAKKELFDKMKKVGYKWNAKTLELEEIKKPKFKPFDKVLVREDNSDIWACSFFSYISDEYDAYPYHCVNGVVHAQCIPYEGNEHLVGTNECPIKE